MFHFHDTSASARVKQKCQLTDYEFLYEDGGNLVAFLWYLQRKYPKHLMLIEKVVESIAPFFKGFYLKPDKINEDQIALRWLEGDSGEPFNAHMLSDGTLRMICLATLLLQPDPPETIIIDEPELGLHPFAIHKLAGMVRKVSAKSQVIISTQSVTLLNEFSPEDIVVVEREDNQTVLKRQNEEQLNVWLERYHKEVLSSDINVK